MSAVSGLLGLVWHGRPRRIPAGPAMSVVPPGLSRSAGGSTRRDTARPGRGRRRTASPSSWQEQELELGQHRALRAAGPEDVDHAVVVPDLARGALTEHAPELPAAQAGVAHGCPQVGQLVGHRHPEQRFGQIAVGMRQVIQVGALAQPPVRLLGPRLADGVAAAEHDLRDGLAEAAADVFEPGRPAPILHGVVQHGGDGLVLAAAVLEHEGGDPEQVRNVRHAGASLADVVSMQDRGVGDRLVEPRADHARHPGAAVEARTTSSGDVSTTTSRAGRPRSCPISASTAVDPSSASGIRIVVSGASM